MSACIAVVDYHKGNLKSVERGLNAAGAQVVVTDEPAHIAAADAVVLPGVGSFADAAASLHALGQVDVLRRGIAAGVPFLGICLGMHLMFEEGVEGASQEDDELSTHNAQGLAILPGVVGALPRTDAEGTRYKVPHVGWNTVNPICSVNGRRAASSLKRSSLNGEAGLTDAAEVFCSSGTAASSGDQGIDPVDSPLFAGIDAGEFFYFTHGYVAPDTPCTIATTTHSVAFPCAVQYKEVAFGVQFHPEKSSDAGARLLRNFVNIVKGA